MDSSSFHGILRPKHKPLGLLVHGRMSTYTQWNLYSKHPWHSSKTTSGWWIALISGVSLSSSCVNEDDLDIFHNIALQL